MPEPNYQTAMRRKTSGRRKAVIALAVAGFGLLLAILVSQASFNLKFISPDSNQQLLFFAGLSASDLLLVRRI